MPHISKLEASCSSTTLSAIELDLTGRGSHLVAALALRDGPCWGSYRGMNVEGGQMRKIYLRHGISKVYSHILLLYTPSSPSIQHIRTVADAIFLFFPLPRHLLLGN